MKNRSLLVAAAFLLTIAGYSTAEGCGGNCGCAGMKEQPAAVESPKAVEVGNKLCPVSGGEIGSMGPGVKLEHEGKIYNLCCQGCVSMFQKDPSVYLKKVEAELSMVNSCTGPGADCQAK